jgi:hypothetical protein
MFVRMFHLKENPLKIISKANEVCKGWLYGDFYLEFEA